MVRAKTTIRSGRYNATFVKLLRSARKDAPRIREMMGDADYRVLVEMHRRNLADYLGNMPGCTDILEAVKDLSDLALKTLDRPLWVKQIVVTVLVLVAADHLGLET